MNTRTLLTVVLTLAVTSACSEGAEREEGPENEAAEAAEMAEAHGSEEGGMIELPADLLARAQVTVEAARAAALARVPGGEVAAGELEEEDGKLIFSFDIRVGGREGIEEVHVDALTGEIIAQEHEGAQEEEAEADEDGGR